MFLKHLLELFCCVLYLEVQSEHLIGLGPGHEATLYTESLLSNLLPGLVHELLTELSFSFSFEVLLYFFVPFHYGQWSYHMSPVSLNTGLSHIELGLRCVFELSILLQVLPQCSLCSINFIECDLTLLRRGVNFLIFARGHICGDVIRRVISCSFLEQLSLTPPLVNFEEKFALLVFVNLIVQMEVVLLELIVQLLFNDSVFLLESYSLSWRWLSLGHII